MTQDICLKASIMDWERMNARERMDSPTAIKIYVPIFEKIRDIARPANRSGVPMIKIAAKNPTLSNMPVAKSKMENSRDFSRWFLNIR